MIVAPGASEEATPPDEVKRILQGCRDNLECFAAITMRTDRGEPVHARASWHGELVRHLTRVSTGQAGRLLLQVPPRHGKSVWASIALPAWHLGRNPAARVLLVSHSATAAARFAMAVREVMESPIYRAIFPEAIPDPNRKWTQTEFFLKQESAGHKDPAFASLGVFSSVLGAGGDLVILDDIVDQESAATESQREKLSGWIRQTVFSRLEPGARVVLIGHRFHIDDFYGEIIREGGWEVVHRPAISADGTALWPERWPVDVLRGQERVMGRAVFQAMYQGDPAELSAGSIITREMLRIDDRLEFPRGAEIGIAVDPAMSEKTTADFFVATAGYRRADGTLAVPRIVRGHFNFRDQLRLLTEMIDELKPYVVGIESTAGGQQLIAMLREARPGTWIRELTPIKDKVTRAAQLIALFEQGKVALGRGFGGEVSSELVSFPVGKHDDCVDSLAWLTHLPLTPQGAEADLSKPVYYGTLDGMAAVQWDYDNDEEPEGAAIARVVNRAMGYMDVMQ